MNDDLICPHCGSINGFSDSFLGKLGLVEHHRCRWCSAQFFTDEVEDGFVLDCDTAVEFISQIPEEDN